MSQRSYYLKKLLEGFGIVLSILLAFGIDAAWQNHQEKEEEDRMLLSLRDEFLVNEQRAAEAVAFHTALRAAGDSLLIVARRGQPEAAQLDELIVNLTWYGSFIVFESASLDAVVLGGKLDLIRNEELRRLLTGWRGALEQAARVEAQEFVHYTEVWLPILRSHANLAQVGNAARAVPGSNEPYWYEPVTDAGDRVDHTPLLRDRAFLNAVTEKLWVEDGVLREYRSLEDRVDQVLALLDSEITR